MELLIYILIGLLFINLIVNVILIISIKGKNSIDISKTIGDVKNILSETFSSIGINNINDLINSFNEFKNSIDKK